MSAEIRAATLLQDRHDPGSLDHAIALAVAAHAGQKDKAGQPYVLHVLRVMMRLPDDAARKVGVMHDVVEDSSLTLEEIAESGFDPDIVEALDAVTRRDGEPYMDYVRRAAANPIGYRVKLADLEDNMDLSRIPDPTDRDRSRLEKYRKAQRFIRHLHDLD